MDKEDDFSIIEKRRVYHRGLFRRFKIISGVELTKDEISNIVFTVCDEMRVCETNVIARDIVKSLQTPNNKKVKSCSLSSCDGKSWVIKINVD